MIYKHEDTVHTSGMWVLDSILIDGYFWQNNSLKATRDGVHSLHRSLLRFSRVITEIRA